MPRFSCDYRYLLLFAVVPFFYNQMRLFSTQSQYADTEAVPVAAVVVMACNRADYLDRTIKSILKYQSLVASKYPLFISQDGSDPHVKSKALSYNQLTYMQDKYVDH